MFYTIENDYIKAVITDLGASLVKFIVKKSNKDLVLGFESEEDYLEYKSLFIGASVGRNANRIGNATFTLNGTKYNLTVNDNENQLHGGESFAHKTFKLEEKKDDKVILSYFSKDLEEGFPGNLNVKVSYKLENNSLIWSYVGESDKDTVFNMTNHSYFNLGEDTILNQELKIYTDKYSKTDDKSLTLDDASSVVNTPYDFRDFTKLNDNLSKLKNGIDNNYVFENLDDKLMATFRNNSLSLNVYSDMPDMHLYTGTYLNTNKGKYGKSYSKFDALCLECQYFPNSINYDSYIKPILKKGEVKKHYIKYVVENR